MSSTRSPVCGSGMSLAMSAWLTMPTRSWPSMTGSRRTAWSFMVRSASSMESSAPMVMGFPVANSATFTELGSLPSATQLTVMSRSVSMPLSRWSSPQIGIAPTSRSRIFLAASASDSLTDTQSGADMMSRAVFTTTPHEDRCVWLSRGTRSRRAKPQSRRLATQDSYVRVGFTPRTEGSGKNARPLRPQHQDEDASRQPT
jgi:hypothetical protein